MRVPCLGTLPASAGDIKRCGFDPWIRRIPWRRAWQPTPVFLPGEPPWTEEPGGLQSIGLQRVRHDWAHTHTHTHTYMPNIPWGWVSTSD